MKNGFKVLITAKLHSVGVPFKNRTLADFVFPKLRDYDVNVASDDPVVLEKAAGFGYRTLALPEGEHVHQTDMRTWRDAVGYVGNIALVQLTSPNVKPEWIDRCMAALRPGVISATCVECEFKVSALYMDVKDPYGAYAQLKPEFGTALTPRQAQPKVVRLSGAVFGFHSDALSLDSFYRAGPLVPVIIDGSDVVDIDTPEQMREFLNKERR